MYFKPENHTGRYTEIYKNPKREGGKKTPPNVSFTELPHLHTPDVMLELVPDCWTRYEKEH